MAKDEDAPKVKQSGKRLCEDWKKDKSTSEWNYAGARGMKDWPVGAEATEKEYDDAITAFASAVLR